MEDLFKKFLYTGVGIVSTTAEVLQKSVDELIDRGSISKEEGKKIVNDFLAEAGNKKGEYEGKAKDLFSKMMNSLDFPTRTEMEKLNARIAELEAQLAAKAKKDNDKKA
jgi:polyhydroxyalkanoate synthesis regulator phasin